MQSAPGYQVDRMEGSTKMKEDIKISKIHAEDDLVCRYCGAGNYITALSTED